MLAAVDQRRYQASLAPRLFVQVKESGKLTILTGYKFTLAKWYINHTDRVGIFVALCGCILITVTSL